MIWNEFLLWEQAARDSIDVKRVYIDVSGDLVAGVLLSQIIFWHLPGKLSETKLRVVKEGVMWVAKGRDDWWDECRITPRQFDRAIVILEEAGVVEKKRFKFGGSPTVHLRIIPEKLMSSVNSILTKGENPIQQKVKMEFNNSVNSLTEITTEITTEKENTIVGQADLPDPPYEVIVEQYQKYCKTLPKIKLLTAARKQTIRARWTQFPEVKSFCIVFAKVDKSDFLSGRNDKWNGCSFDWIIKQQNFLKIMEGNYDNKDRPKTPPPPKLRGTAEVEADRQRILRGE